MAVNWTKEQEQVINLRNRNILVSAAAGSGKTAVLVQRILKKVMDPEHPVDVHKSSSRGNAGTNCKCPGGCSL
mgnify:CR=1 FL=1